MTEPDEKQVFLMRLRNTRMFPHWNPPDPALESEPELFRRMLMGTPPKRLPYTPDAWGMPKDKFQRYLDFVGAVVGRETSPAHETPTEMAERLSREEQRYQAWWAEQGEIEWLRYISAFQEAVQEAVAQNYSTTPAAEECKKTASYADAAAVGRKYMCLSSGEARATAYTFGEDMWR